VHVLYGYDLYFIVNRLVYEQDLEGLQVQWKIRDLLSVWKH
jgi:hypothetical protein